MISVVKAAAVCIFNSVNDCYPKRMFGCNVGFLGDSTFVFTRGVVAHWLQRLTSNRSGVSSNPIKGSRCFIVRETLPSLPSIVLLQGRIPLK